MLSGGLKMAFNIKHVESKLTTPMNRESKSLQEMPSPSLLSQVRRVEDLSKERQNQNNTVVNPKSKEWGEGKLGSGVTTHKSNSESGTRSPTAPVNPEKPDDTMILHKLKNGFMFNPQGLWRHEFLRKTEFIANWDKVKDIDIGEKGLKISLTERHPKYGEVISLSIDRITKTTLKFLTTYNAQLKSSTKITPDRIHKIDDAILHIIRLPPEHIPSKTISIPRNPNHTSQIHKDEEERQRKFNERQQRFRDRRWNRKSRKDGSYPNDSY